MRNGEDRTHFPETVRDFSEQMALQLEREAQRHAGRDADRPIPVSAGRLIEQVGTLQVYEWVLGRGPRPDFWSQSEDSVSVRYMPSDRD